MKDIILNLRSAEDLSKMERQLEYYYLNASDQVTLEMTRELLPTVDGIFDKIIAEHGLKSSNFIYSFRDEKELAP